PLDRLAGLRDLAQLHVTPFAVLGLHPAAELVVALAQFGHEGAARALEGVEVQVQVDAADRLRAAVAPGQLLAAGDGVLVGIQRGRDLVPDHAVGERVFVAGARAAPGIGRTRDAHRSGVGAGERD